eukprot:18752-Chlamydomonas_euryale.AAC.1
MCAGGGHRARPALHAHRLRGCVHPHVQSAGGRHGPGAAAQDAGRGGGGAGRAARLQGAWVGLGGADVRGRV